MKFFFQSIEKKQSYKSVKILFFNLNLFLHRCPAAIFKFNLRLFSIFSVFSVFEDAEVAGVT